jgi:hypothetical protein
MRIHFDFPQNSFYNWLEIFVQICVHILHPNPCPIPCHILIFLNGENAEFDFLIIFFAIGLEIIVNCVHILHNNPKVTFTSKTFFGMMMDFDFC